MPMYRPRLLSQISSQLSSVFSGSPSTRKGSKRKGLAKVGRAALVTAEVLENRRLLSGGSEITTTEGETQTLTFQSIRQTYENVENGTPPEGHFVTIQQSGDTSAYYAGAFLDETNTVQLASLPAVSSNGYVYNGGLGGEQGTQLYGQVQVNDPIPNLAGGSNLDYPNYSSTGTTAIDIDALAADTDPANSGVLYGINLIASADGASGPVIQIIEFPNSAALSQDTQNDNSVNGDEYASNFIVTPAVTGQSYPDPNPRGDGIVVAQLNDIQNFINGKALTPDGTTTAVAPAAVTAAAFNPVDGLLYFVVQGNGSTPLDNLYSINVHAGDAAENDEIKAQEIAATLTKSPGIFGATAAQAAVGNNPAVVGAPVKVSAITFDQTSATTSTMYAWAIVTPVGQVSSTNPTGAPGAPTADLETYPFAANTTLSVGAPTTENKVNVVTDGEGTSPTFQITGLSFEGNTTTANETTIYATTSALGPAGGTSGTSSTGSSGQLFRIDLATDNAIEIAELANPIPTADAGGVITSTSELGNDIQDFVWEPYAYDPVNDYNPDGSFIPNSTAGAFVGIDAAADEIAVISTSVRPGGVYLYAIYVASGSLANSVIAVASPSDNDYDVLTDIPATGAPSGQLSPTLGDSGDVLVTLNGNQTGEGYVQAPADTGYAYLGLKSNDLTPILTANSAGDVLPIDNPNLPPGLSTASGVQLDKFYFGGTVTGSVDFGGSTQNFYAGWLITGSSAGASGTQYTLALNSVTSGSYNLTVTTLVDGEPTSDSTTFENGAPIAFNASASTIQSLLQELGNINDFGNGSVQVEGADGGPYEITFSGSIGPVELTLTDSKLVSNAASPVTIAGGAEYNLSIGAGVTSGTYDLLVIAQEKDSTTDEFEGTDGSALGSIPYNATAATIQADLEALVGDITGFTTPPAPDTVTVTGPAGGPYDILFSAALGAVTLELEDSNLLPSSTAVNIFQVASPLASSTGGLIASGDLRNVWVQSFAGTGGTIVADVNFNTSNTAGTYYSGFGAVIGGQVDEFRVVDTLVGDVIIDDDASDGGINSTDDPDTGLPIVQQKLFNLEGQFGTGDLSGSALFTNTTFATPQYLGSLSAANPVITLDGTLEGSIQPPKTTDKVDYYAVALLAGQTITVQLQEPEDIGDSLLNIGVFDPDDRLIASDYSMDNGSGAYGTVGGDQTAGQPFQIKTTMPGTYRFAVAYDLDDPNFTGTGDASTALDDIPYVLNVGLVDTNGNPGNITLGGIYVGTLGTNDTGYETVIDDLGGDIGAVHADGSILNTSIIDEEGNLIDVDATDIGKETGGNATTGYTYTDDMEIAVPVGAVGLLRATDASTVTGVLFVEPLALDENVLDPVTHLPYIGEPVGTDIQVVQAAGLLACSLSANDAIGTIQAGSMADETFPNTFAVNPENNPNIAGRIDLIDCTGDFGTLGEGGPAITTGPNGDVGFINVGGEVFQDSYFGGGSPDDTVHDPGVPVTVTDDGGATITFTPVGAVTANPAYNASTATTSGIPATLGPAIDIEQYGIRGSGGVVVISVTVTDDGGLDVTSTGTSTDPFAEVGTINVTNTNTGPAVIDESAATNTSTGTTTSTNASNPSYVSPLLSTTVPNGGNIAPSTNIIPIELDPSSTDSLTVNISGNDSVDVYDIIGAYFTSIINSTPGEIVNIQATSIGLLQSSGPLGIASNSTGANLYPARVINNTFPFDEQHYGIVINGDIVQVQSSSAVGNFLVNGSIGSIVADSGHATDPNGVFAGIDGPIVTTGQIQSVDIGQGILSSGTGSVGFAGLYAGDVIGLVTNSRPYAEIRGTVESQVEINAIVLSNSSIIDATISVFSSAFVGTDQLPGNLPVENGLGGTQESPIYSLGQITLTGDAGMIGDNVDADGIGPTVVSGGYGIFFCLYKSDGDGLMAGVSASGYGIRGSLFQGGYTQVGLDATGNGSQISVNQFDPNLFPNRQSSSGLIAFDPFTGLLPCRLDDLDENLVLFGVPAATATDPEPVAQPVEITSATTPEIPGVTDSGVIEDTQAVGDGTLGHLIAETIREVAEFDDDNYPELPNPATIETLNPGEQGSFGSEFNFATAINNVDVRGSVDGLELTTGKLGTFTVGSKISRTGITVSGEIKNLVIHGDYGAPLPAGEIPPSQVPVGDSYIYAVGGSGGVIQNLKILGNLYASVLATGSITNLTVALNLEGDVTVNGETKGLVLGTLHIGGGLLSGALTFNGSVGSIITNGSLGYLGNPTMVIVGSLNELLVGQSRVPGAVLALPMTIEGNVKEIIVNGTIEAPIQVDGKLNLLEVNGIGSSPSNVISNVNVSGGISSIVFTKANLLAEIDAGGTINSAVFNRGSIEAGASLQSAIGSLRSVRVTGGLGYGVYGSLLATDGVNENISISGSLGNGTNTALITALSGNSFVVQGSIAANANIAVTTKLNLLQVTGNIQSGAVISAHPLKKQKVKGTNTGTITVI